LRLRDTGHSIHIERPRYFAHEIVKFLNAGIMEVTCITREGGHIRRLGVASRRDNRTFTMTVEECVAAIDRGDEFFVAGANGNIANVGVHGAGESQFLWAAANESETDNLSALPDC
jgi:hypothetical protein